MNNYMYFILTIVPDCELKDHFTDSTEILFSKLRFAGLNYHLLKLSFFTDPYCAGSLTLTVRGYLISFAY